MSSGFTIPTKHILFAGNPGSGKSTLLNCAMQSSTLKGLSASERFQSGVAIGSGMTYQLDYKELDGVVYMDTPGLSDTQKRKQAAEAITEALKKDGLYQIVFVVTLESGRVRPDDVTTITLVLDSAKEITHYGVIFNKIGDGVMKVLDARNRMELLSQVSLDRSRDKPIPVPLFLGNFSELEDANDVVRYIPELDEFLQMLFPIQIHKEKVDEISIESYAELREAFEKELTVLKENNRELVKKIREDKELFQQRIGEILEQEKLRHEEQARQMKENHDLVMKQMEQQLEQSRANAELMEKRDERAHELLVEQMKSQQQTFDDMMAQQEKSYQVALNAASNNNNSDAKLQFGLGLIQTLFEAMLV